MNPPAPTATVLVLTMPGFGIETLRRFAAMPVWARLNVTVALVGRRPPAWRYATALLRRTCRRSSDRVHRLADGTVCSRDAERLLRSLGVRWCWLASDAEVRQFRAALRPALTLTITSRILFSSVTLEQPPEPWLNLHPGLLPGYAGASPAPYMFFDGVGGCTIHGMAAKVDGGPIVDLAPMTVALGDDVAAYFFDRLPDHAAQRLATVVGRWADGRIDGCVGTPPSTLRYFSKARLARDRQLDWRQSPERLVRWVHALAAIAPAWWAAADGRRVEVMAAVVGASVGDAAAGTVMAVQGRKITVACGDGGQVVLRCRSRPRARAGDLLPAQSSVSMS